MAPSYGFRGTSVARRLGHHAHQYATEAQKEAEVTRGEADARRNAIFAGAFTRNSEFFEFYRSLNAYEGALKGSNSSLVLSPDSEFFNYLKSSRGAAAAQ